MPARRFSFIIVNYQSARFLDECLSSIRRVAAIGKLDEIIIINNDPRESAALEALCQRHAVCLIENSSNTGFGSANNLGAQQASGAFLLLLNPDTVILEADLTALAERFEQSPETAIIGLRLLKENGDIQPWNAGSEVTFWDIARNNLGFPKSRKIWTSDAETSAAWVSGGALAIRRSIFETLNGFDEQFFLYFEDVDLCQRARSAGHAVTLFPGTVVSHRCGGSSASTRVQKQEFYRSQDLYFRKHRPVYERWLVSIARRLTHF